MWPSSFEQKPPYAWWSWGWFVLHFCEHFCELCFPKRLKQLIREGTGSFWKKVGMVLGSLAKNHSERMSAISSWSKVRSLGLCLSVSLWLYRCLCQTYWSGHLELQVKGLGCLVHNWSTAHLCCWGRKGHPLDVSVHGGAWLWHLWPLTPQDGHLAVSKNPEHYRWSTFHFIYFHFVYSKVCCSGWPDCSHKF